MSIASRGPTLVATDLSEAADEALRQGSRLADCAGGRLVVCHVLPDISEVRVLFPQDAGPDQRGLENLVARARTVLHARIETVIGHPLSERDVVIEYGSPYAALHDVAERIGAALVVLGPGSTARRMAHHAAWAVLVARPSPPDGVVLGATDLSDPAIPALEAAAGEAKRRDVPLRLMHAVDFDFGALLAMPVPIILPTQAMDAGTALVESAQARLEECLRRFDVKGDVFVARGPAVTSIMEAATSRPTSLIVVGTRGRSGLPRIMLGSVAETVMRDAPCSVLAVPLAGEAA